MDNFDYKAYLKSKVLFKYDEKKSKLLTELKSTKPRYKVVDSNSDNEIEESVPTKIKISELKFKIREEILFNLNEKDKKKDEEDEKDDVEDINLDDIDLGDGEDVVDEPVIDDIPDEGGDEEIQFSPEEGLTKDEKQIQDALKLAYDNALQIADDKLAKQIGNTITMFTRTHIVGGNQVAEDDVDGDFFAKEYDVFKDYTKGGIPDSDVKLKRKPKWKDIGDSEEEDEHSGLRRSKY